MFELERHRYLTKEVENLINEAKEAGELDSFKNKMSFISKVSAQSLISKRSGVVFDDDQQYLDFMEVVLYGCEYSLEVVYINVMKRFGGEEFLTERLDENGNVVVDENGRVIYDSDCFQNAKGFTKAELKELAPEYQNEGFYVTAEEAEELYGGKSVQSLDDEASEKRTEEDEVEELSKNLGISKDTIEATKIVAETQKQFKEDEEAQKSTENTETAKGEDEVKDKEKEPKKRNKLRIK